MNYVQVLTKELEKRKARNGRYSIRAFAKHLGVQSATLSAVLKKTRHLSFRDAETISRRLFDDADESQKFIVSYLKDKAAQAAHDFIADEASNFRLIAEWEYRAVLTLMDTRDFRPSTSWIARRLGITAKKAKEVVGHLKEVGLLKQDSAGTWVKTLAWAESSDDVKSSAIQHAHRNELSLAVKKQDELDVTKREFESLCFAAEKKNLPKIKKQVRDFIRQIERTYETKEADEVYLLNCQLFPLSQDAANEK